MRNPKWTDQENLIIYCYLKKFPDSNKADLATELKALKFSNGDSFINDDRSLNAIKQHIEV